MAQNDSLLQKSNSIDCNSVQEIAIDLMRFQGVRGIAGVMLLGLSKSYLDSIESKKDDFIYEPSVDEILFSKFNDLITENLNSNSCKSMEKYMNYIEPIFASGMSGRIGDPSSLLSDKLTNYDMQCIFNLICHYSAIETFNFFKRGKESYKSWVKDEKLSSLINVSNDSVELERMKDSDKAFRKTARTLKRTFEYLDSCNINFSENYENVSLLRGSFRDAIEMLYSSPLKNISTDNYRRVILILTLLLQAYLVGTFKTLFGKEIFLGKELNKNISFSLNEREFKSVMECISLYSFLSEHIVNDIKNESFKMQSFESDEHPSSMLMNSLISYKEIFLNLVERFKCESDDSVNSKDLLNHYYDVLCKDYNIGKKEISNLFLNDTSDWCNKKSASSILNLDITGDQILYKKEFLEKVIDEIKNSRVEDSGKYSEFVDYKLQFDYLAKAARLIDANLYNNSDFEIKYNQVYESSCKEFNTNKLSTVFEDHSDFGCVASLLSFKSRFDDYNETCFRGLKLTVDNALERILMIFMVNTHIKNETVVKWTPNMINLLNIYISFISSKVLSLIDRDIGSDGKSLSNVLNLGNLLNYRNNQIPNFKYKKEGVVAPKFITSSFEDTMISNCREIISRVKSYGNVSSKEALYNGVIKYIADAIINGTMNAEYAIFTIIYMNYKYHFNDNKKSTVNFFGYAVGNGSGDSRTPFTDITRYIISHIGEKDGEFYKPFENPEIIYNVNIYQDSSFDETKTSIERLQNNLEAYIFISICQRIIMMLNFHSSISNDVNNLPKYKIEYFKVIGMNESKYGYACPSRIFSFGENENILRNDDGDEIAVSEIPAIKDISNAMNIFDSLLSQNQKNYNWFEEHKHLILGTTDNKNS